MKRKAFTMLELVFAIVVIGILASLAMPRIDRDIRQEAADNILSAIRYTQQLALVDDKTNPAQLDWQKAFWNIRFEQYYGNSKWFYVVSTNNNRDGNVDSDEVAIDPSNGKAMNNTDSATLMKDSMATDSPNVFLTEKYGVKSVDFTDCEGDDVRHIAFDHLGRTHKGVYGAGTAYNDYRTYVNSECKIKFTFAADAGLADLEITIQAETGYAQIVGQPDS